ncbi:hypothetical protein NW752_004576 [Fusarium irregulare]|uniref:Zn(2)-C6 fungal-type domain-containing protein n=1 Tax=Fusarium irregulare TaxID=2494466 RepID=A0A9W8PP79_9HYPO|nr:hypothetical protein NW766_007483 [Fusarium irregulare]KAJ4021568.1 hypothetical protein NW752_004576 [Fusarium irregulare]
MTTDHSHDSLLADIVQELDPNAPPAAPRDLTSTVSSLFAQRREKLREERRARKDAAIDAAYATARAIARKKEEATQEAVAEKKYRHDRALSRPRPRVKDINPSKKEIDDLIEKEVAREAKGRGLQPAKGETEKRYEERMRALEDRVDDLDFIEQERTQHDPTRYIEGFPVNLVLVHRHVRLSPRIPFADFACLQCKALGRRCGRRSDDTYFCERCYRNNRRCLVKHHTECEEDHARTWKFAPLQRCRHDGLRDEIWKWMGKLQQRKNGGDRIRPWPAWHTKSSDGELDTQNIPKRWQDYFESASKGKDK